MMRGLAVLLALSLQAPPEAGPSSPEDADLLAGIALVKDGDFEAAVPKLDAAIRNLEAQPQQAKELARAYLYLGVTYLELDLELSARGRFREALARDPDLRLSPREFSAQVMRVFEAERQAFVAPPAEQAAAPPTHEPAAPPKPRVEPAKPAASKPAENPGKKKGGSKAVLFIVGGGAAAAGAAFAVGGGGGGSGASTTTSTTESSGTTSTTSTTTTSTTSTTATSTTTTTTQPPAGCQYQMSPPTQNFSPIGGPGACQVKTSLSSCGWSAESTDDFILLTPPASGTGDGSVNFTVTANPPGSGKRTGRIRLAEDHDVRCEITQDAGVGGVARPSTAFAWTSQLDVPGARGQVIVNGTIGLFHERGLSHGTAEGRPGLNRIEAQLVTAEARPGTWQFELGGAFRPGTLRMIAGQVVTITTDTVVFHLRGVPGERLVFAFRTK